MCPMIPSADRWVDSGSLLIVAWEGGAITFVCKKNLSSLTDEGGRSEGVVEYVSLGCDIAMKQ